MTRSLSRRTVLRAFGGAGLAMSLAGVLAACGGGSGNAPAAAPTSGGSAAQSGSSPGQPTAQPAATAASQSAPKNAVVMWYGTDYLASTTDTLKTAMDNFTKKTNIATDFELKSGSWGDQLNAAVQAGTAPDLWQSYDYQCQYWEAQGQALEISQVISKYQSQKGGFWPYVTATVSTNGKAFAAPLAVNTWPFHARQDLLDKFNNGKWPATWDELRALGKEITQAPKLYAFGWTMGKIDDANNHFIGTLWTYGGKLQNEDGSFGLKANDEAALATLDLASKMYNDDKSIPPAVVQWDNGGNNNSYQEEQIAWTSNALSVYGWCQQHKPELAKITSLYSYPKGPAGSFGQVDVWGLTAWKNTKQADNVLQFLDVLVDPTNHADRIKTLQPRFTPIYQDMINDPIWNQPIYQGMIQIAKTGQIMAYAASPQSGYSTFTTRYLIGEMMQNLIVKKLSAQDAYKQFYDAAQAIYAQY